MHTFLTTWSLRLLLIANGLLSGALLLACLASVIPPTISTTVAWLGLGYPYLGFVNLWLVGWWFYKRSKLIYVSLPSVCISFLFINRYIQSPTITTNTDAAELTVATYNVHYFDYLYQRKEASLHENLDTILHAITRLNASILCLQEFSGYNTKLSNAAWGYMNRPDGYPYQHRGGKSSLAIYSRFPIVNSGILTFPNSFNSVIFADLALPKQTVRVYNMHLQSTRLGVDAEHLLEGEDLTNIKNKETSDKYKRIRTKVQHAFVLRTEQARALAKHIRDCQYPVLLCGDMNDTPISYAYGVLTTDLYDSFTEQGSGFGSTYAGNIPLLRIDYIMASKHFNIRSHEVQPLEFSDHYPIVTTLDFAR